MSQTICDARVVSRWNHREGVRIAISAADTKSGSEIWATLATRLQGSCEISAAATVLMVNAQKLFGSKLMTDQELQG